MRNPPASPILATFSYYGPSLRSCGEPTVALVDASGAVIPFLSATFDRNSNLNGNSNRSGKVGEISISLLDKSTAVKGTYEIVAVLT